MRNTVVACNHGRQGLRRYAFQRPKIIEMRGGVHGAARQFLPEAFDRTKRNIRGRDAISMLDQAKGLGSDPAGCIKNRFSGAYANSSETVDKGFTLLVN